MKFAYMSFSAPEASLPDLIRMATDYGYDGVEPRTSADHKHGVEPDSSPDARAQIRSQFDETPVELCCIATSCTFSDPAQTDASVELAHQQIDLAGDLACPRLRVFGGTYPESVSRNEAIDTCVRALRAVADHAGERDVTLCLETHDAWTDPKHFAEVVQRVDHPRIAVNWDMMHPVRQSGYSIEQSFEILKPWIRHCHAHDGVNTLDELTLKPLGEGDFDHRRMIELLKADGYDGYISGEWIGWEPADVHLPREIKALRQYLAEA